MKKIQTPVLIVGAGPTGLMAACQLRRFGIDCVVIEKRNATTQLSKALGVQARTMELYQQMGLMEKALPQGLVAKKMNLLVNGKAVQNIPLGDIGEGKSPFPYLFVLEQSKNEALLYDYLKEHEGDVSWNHELLDIEETENKVIATVKGADETTYQIEADWLIGADGGKSPVRHILGLKFAGDTYDNIFYVADTTITWDLPYEELLVNLAKHSFAAFFPMKGDRRFRMVGILPEEFKDVPLEDLTFEHLQENIRTTQKIKLEFGQTRWFAVYKVHHRCVESFRLGRCFLAGDAAHVHSPAGGQGMNTGLQDAYNLSWKLAYVIKGKVDAKALDTYNDERLPVAQKLVETTDSAFTRVVSKGTLSNFFKMKVFPYIAGTVMGWDSIRARVFNMVSQIGIRYRNSYWSHAGFSLPKSMPKPGDRLPYVQIYDPNERVLKDIYQYLTAPCFHVLVFLHNNDRIGDKEAQKVVEVLGRYWGDLFKPITIQNTTENVPAFEKMGIPHSLIMLVRPDNYIGYIGKVEDVGALENYLKHFF